MRIHSKEPAIDTFLRSPLDQPHPSAFYTSTIDTSLSTVTHQNSNGAQGLGKIIPIPTLDAYMAIVQLQDFPSHNLWRGNKLIYSGGHAWQSLSIAHLVDELKCQHLATFNNVRFHIPRHTLDEISHDLGGKRITSLRCVRGQKDPVIFGLAQALLPSLSAPEQADRLFVDHVMMAFTAHVSRHYAIGWTAPKARDGGLASWQERRAKDYMSSHLEANLTLDEIARQCGLSRSHFSRSFKTSTGVAPFEWLRQCRMTKARELLRLPHRSIADIAVECGFTDQSHFTRVFGASNGMSPSAWKKTFTRQYADPNLAPKS
jgi:AraC family transcriptional regulator